MEQEKLTTVHHALAEAATEAHASAEGPMGTYTFRCHEQARKEAEELCVAHGTTLAEYLRKCIELLPRDYRP